MKWPQVRFEDVALPEKGSIVSGPFGSSIGSRFFVDEGVPVIRGNNLSFGDRRFIDDGFVFLSDEKAAEFHRCQAIEDDLVFTAAGTIGQVGIIPKRTRVERYVISNKQLRVRCNRSIVNPLFVFMWFTTPGMRQHIINKNSGSTIPLINLGILRGLPVPLPPLEVQEKIADTLTAYDDLMENNRRRMALLEESARLLYREWFVHLRFPGHEHTRLTNGVPEGWTVKPLQEVADFRLGKMLDDKKNRGEPLPYLANINLRWGVFDLTNLREMRFEEHELETFGLKFGDIVMCEGGEPGRCAIWKDQMPGMMFQKAIHRIRCRENMDHEYLYQSLRHQAETGHFATLFTGATIKHFPREKLAKVTVVVPPRRLLDLFVNDARPIETQLGLLEAANRRASAARDLLLPRLMSGELAV